MPEILIVDDHPSVRQGVKQFITDEMPGSVFGEAETAADALRQLLKRRFRVVVLPKLCHQRRPRFGGIKHEAGQSHRVSVCRIAFGVRASELAPAGAADSGGAGSCSTQVDSDADLAARSL